MLTESVRSAPEIKKKISVGKAEQCSVQGAKPKIKPKLRNKPKPNTNTNTNTKPAPKLKLNPAPTLKPAPKLKLNPAPKPKLKSAPTPKPKPANKENYFKIIPKPLEINSEAESECEDDILYERWINGEQLLISMDNKYIYDPNNYNLIGTVMDDASIIWVGDD